MPELYVLTTFAHTLLQEPQPAAEDPPVVEIPQYLVKFRPGFRRRQRIYKPGYRYKKAGVMLGGIASASAHRQESLFEAEGAGRKSDGLMAALDALNSRFGRDVVSIGAAGIEKRWTVRAARKSPCFTTRWSELPVVRAQ